MSSRLAYHRIHEPVNRGLRLWLSPLKKLLLLYRSVRLVRAELEISTPGDSSVPCLYLGEGLSLEYYRKLYASPGTPATPISGAKLIAEVDRARHRFPVVLVETNQLIRGVLPAGGLPTYNWIRQQTDLTGEPYRRRRRGIERGYGQAVRSRGYECRFSERSSDLELFHRVFHVPHVLSRHGELAAGRTLPQLRSGMRSGFLLQVWRGGQWVSGLVAERAGAGRICPLAVGLHSDFPEERQAGAIAAAYYFLIEWARQNEIRMVDFGGSRPHLGDGVFRHKSLWGADAVREPWHHTTITFYLDAAARLPDSVKQQLVWQEQRFISIGECVPAAAAAGHGCLDTGVPLGFSNKLAR